MGMVLRVDDPPCRCGPALPQKTEVTMVANEPRDRTHKAQAKRVRQHGSPAIRVASPSAGRDLFDHQARQALDISGEEFLRRWDAGVYRSNATEEGRAARRLAMLIPFARRTKA